MSDIEQLREPFHLKKLSYRRARRNTFMPPWQGDGWKWINNCFPDTFAICERITFWSDLRSNQELRNNKAPGGDNGATELSETERIYQLLLWCRGLKKNSKGAEAGGQSAVVKKGRSQGGKQHLHLLIPSVYSVLMLIFIFIFFLITYILLRSISVCFGKTCLLAN